MRQGTVLSPFFVRDVSRIGQRGSGVRDGPPWSSQRTPPSASALRSPSNHGSSSYLVRSHDGSSFRSSSERLCLVPKLFGLPAPPPEKKKPETPEILPLRPKTYLGNVEHHTHFAPTLGTKGFAQRREGSSTECTSGAFFECKGNRKNWGRIAWERMDPCVGCRKQVLGWEPSIPLLRSGGIERSIDRSIDRKAPGLRLGLDRADREREESLWSGEGSRPRWHGCGAFRVLVGRKT